MGPYFNSRDKHYKDPFGAVPCGAEVRFALADDTYYGCELLVHKNPEGVAMGINPFVHGSAKHTDIMKTEGLKQALN